MNTAQLLAHFERISEAPDAIVRLRRLILDLAIRGKLVEQDPKDEPAAELLKQIDLRSSTIGSADEPFPRPEKWEFVRLGECLEMINGRAFKPTDWLPSGLPIVRIQNLNKLDAPFNYCDPATVADRHVIENGCFLISWSGTPGTSFGAFIWTRGKAALNQHIFKCIPIGEIYGDRFLQLAINGRLDEMIAKAHGGVGLQHITKGKLENLALSLPPLAEQRRIVAKVEELMALCDKLEMARKERESRRDRLAAASLALLDNGADAEAFRDHARFHLRHLPRLTTRPDQIPGLRKTILNLAVRGKLVSQDPNVEPASRLVNRIQVEKESLVRAGTIKREDAFEPVAENEKLFDIPGTWNWVRLGAICHPVSSGSTPPQHVFQKETDIPYLKVYNIREQLIDFDYKPQFISREYHATKLRRSRLFPGDVIMNIVGPPLGKVAIVPPEFAEWNCNQAIVFFRPVVADLTKYLYWFLREGSFLSRIDLIGTAGQDNISVTKSKHIAFPLPPLTEQRGIVAKVEELMALCDRLETQLITTQTDSRRLLEAVLHEALAPAE